MMEKTVCIFSNNSGYSLDTMERLYLKLKDKGYLISEDFNEKAELIICIGGDGAFLSALHKHGFPQTKVLGINTGHLGFFQEISPKQIDEFLEIYEKGAYSIQSLRTTETTVQMGCGERSVVLMSLNEVVIKQFKSRTAHLNIFMGDSFVESFSGDGILVCPPAGSTAYNYSLGGSIVDPRLDLMQITPIAPMNTSSYRSFTSSVLVPPSVPISIVPEIASSKDILISTDGMEYNYEDVDQIFIRLSEKRINLIRFENYNFWSKVKSKIL